MTEISQNSETDPALMEAGRLLFAGPCDFITSVTAVSDLPDDGRPEVAFAGRSNVGKSSLINALTGRKTLARTSNTPGRTRQLNYFALGPALYLVDMPGYGYAKASKSLIKAWTTLIFDYLRGRPPLRRVYLLIDARHGLKPGDRQAMKLMDEAAVSYQVVLTKCDKPKRAELARLTAATARELALHPAAHPEILATSSRSGAGVAELRAGIAQFDTETH